ncbi:hypothetical protein O9993_13770 [Vibrio lentus]|nr:hypothetical protein [Vibrio lentus]
MDRLLISDLNLPAVCVLSQMRSNRDYSLSISALRALEPIGRMA